MMPRYRKKPIEVEAIRYDTAAVNEVIGWIHLNGGHAWVIPNTKVLFLETLEGGMRANPGDWIVQGVVGEFYPCNPEVFELTYEKIGDSESELEPA